MTRLLLSPRLLSSFSLATLAWAVLALAGLVWVTGVNAAACPPQFPVTAPPKSRSQPQSLHAETELLKALQTSCLDRADYFAYQGQLLLQQRQPKAALESLERSLLLQPDQPGVQLDFAIALAEVGDRSSSKALTEMVLARADVPAAVRQLLQNLALDLGTDPSQALDSSVWHSEGVLQTLLGFDKNLNNAPVLDYITLTLPNGSIPLALNSASQAQGGLSWIHSAQLASSRAWGVGLMALSADWQARQTPGHEAYHYGYYQIGASLKPLALGPWRYRAALSHYQTAESKFFSGLLLGVSHEDSLPTLAWGKLQPCRYRAALEAESRSYHQDPLQNSTYHAATGALSCDQGAHQWLLQGQWGQDLAQAMEKAGGNQRRAELKSQWLYRQDSVDWVGELTIGRVIDERAYSSLLGGLVRQATRAQIKLSYSKPVVSVPGLYALGSVESSRHQSNIELFNTSGRAAYIGLRYIF